MEEFKDIVPDEQRAIELSISAQIDYNDALMIIRESSKEASKDIPIGIPIEVPTEKTPIGIPIEVPRKNNQSPTAPKVPKYEAPRGVKPSAPDIESQKIDVRDLRLFAPTSQDWESLFNLEPVVLKRSLHILHDETMKYEQGISIYPFVEFTIGLARDQIKEEKEIEKEIEKDIEKEIEKDDMKVPISMSDEER